VALDVETLMTRMELDLTPFEKALSQMPKETQKSLREVTKEIVRSAKAVAKEQEKLAIKTSKVQRRAAAKAVKEAKAAAAERKKASAKAARAEQQDAKDTARAHERAAREIEGSYNEQFGAIKGLSGAAFGGVAGDAFDLTDTLAGVSAPLAALGLGLAALSIAPELLSGIYEFASGVEETAEALGVVLSPAQQASQAKFAASTKDLTRAFNELKLAAQLAAGEGLVPLMQDGKFLLDTLAGVLDVSGWFGELGEAVGESKREFEELMGPVAWFGKFLVAGPGQLRMLREAFGEVTATFEPMKLGLEGVQGAFEDVNEEAKKTGKVYFDSGESAASVFKAIRDKRKKAAKESADAVAQMEKEALEDIAAARNAEARADRARYDARVKQGHHATAAAVADMQTEQDAEREAQIAEGERRQQALDADVEAIERRKQLLAELQSAARDSAAAVFGAIATFQGLAIDKLVSAGAKQRAELNKTTASMQKLQDARAAAADEDKANYKNLMRYMRDERKLKRKELKATRREVKQKFKAMKRLQIAASIINGSAAMIAALAPPPIGAGPIVGAVMSVGIAATTAAQVATIASQQPPKFHRGTSHVQAPARSEVPAVLEAGEAVVRREAMLQPGARDVVERMNAGGAPGQQSLAVYLNDRMVDTMVARADRSSGQGRRGLAMAGVRTMYDRRR